MGGKDYYRILGLADNASADEIRRAYRQLAMRYHPDRNHGVEEWANDKFKEINEAFQVLGDPKKRTQYDHFGIAGDPGDIFRSQAWRTTVDDLVNDDGEDGLGFDVFDSIFSDSLRGTRFASQRFRRGLGGLSHTGSKAERSIDPEDLSDQSQAPRGSTVSYEIVLSKEEAFKGIEKELHRRGKRLMVEIPAGVTMGSRIRLRNALNTTDGQPGDIVITIKVRQDATE